MAASIAFQATDTDNATIAANGTYTFSLTVAGAAGQERLVAIAGIGALAAAADYVACTIDGVAATRVGTVSRGVNDGSNVCAFVTFYRAAGTAATTINVVVTKDGTGSCFAGYCALWTLYDADTLTATTNAATADPALNTATTAGGVVAAVCFGYSGTSPTMTWMGLTEDFDAVRVFGNELFSGASAAITTGETPRTIGGNTTPDPSASIAAICVSFASVAAVVIPGAGLPYFAWAEASETTFEPAHMRWDENVLSFELAQEEGDPASLTVVVRRPRNEAGDPIGLLGPGRKIWVWFALDCGGDLIRFRGRLVGVPTSIFEELVTLEFIARPFDVVAQKEALAATLRVLPHYDEVVIDKERRTDPEVVLEGYTKIWHYDRETHILTVSDEITGEDGLVEFDGASEAGKVLWDGLGLTLASGPLARVDVIAEFTWTQGARGNVDLTDYLISHWDSSGMAKLGAIASYTLSADSWPKNGTGLGDGWEVAQASAVAAYDLEVQTRTEGGTTTTNFGDGETCTATASHTQSYLAITPPGSILYSEIVTSNQYQTSASSISSSHSSVKHVLPLHHTVQTLTAKYVAERDCVERVSFSLFADVQHILTDPEDGEALRIDDVRSVNLSEPIGEGTDAYVPMSDARRRSYIATERGNRSIEHLIALARTHLMKRARVVEITFAPKLERMPEITLRKNAVLVEPRVGEALGKVIGYAISLDGSDGRINCEVRIGCAIGRGGSTLASDGTPTYCSIDYTGADYQQFTGRTVVLFDSSVGYSPPLSNPNDDGIEFLSVLRAEDVIDVPLAVENPPQIQHDYILEHTAAWLNFYGVDSYVSEEDVQKSLEARTEAVSNALKEVETRATFKLKSMTREFLSDYEIQVTDLSIPTGYDLEAA